MGLALVQYNWRKNVEDPELRAIQLCVEQRYIVPHSRESSTVRVQSHFLQYGSACKTNEFLTGACTCENSQEHYDMHGASVSLSIPPFILLDNFVNLRNFFFKPVWLRSFYQRE